jgi:nucleoside-diphosphate-sugar epimerase
MKAALLNKVKRVVITSSIAAVIYKRKENEKEIYDEEDWSDIDACPPYEKSKLLAEKAAWDFIDSLPVEERFELVVLNPSLV